MPLYCRAPGLPGAPQAGSPPESVCRFVTVQGVRLHLHEAGEGPLLLLIHGGAPGAYGMGNFGQNLPGLAREVRTVIVDLPGCGGSDPATIVGGRYSFYAALFTDLIHQLGAQSASVVGMATGGGVAIAMAAASPQVVDRLVLVGPAGGLPLFSVSPSEGIKTIRDYYNAPGPSLEKMRAYLEMIVFDASTINDTLVEERYEMSIAAPRTESGPGAENMWDMLPRISAPTLLLWGRDNRLQGYDNGLFMLNRIPDAELHVFARTGLWIPWERQKRFESLVLDFLSRFEGPSA